MVRPARRGTDFGSAVARLVGKLARVGTWGGIFGSRDPRSDLDGMRCRRWHRLNDIRHVVAAGSICGLALGVLDLAIGGGTPLTSGIAMLASFIAAGTAAGLGLLVIASPLRLVRPARVFSPRRLAVASYVGALTFFVARYALRAPASWAGQDGWRGNAALFGAACVSAALVYVKLPAFAKPESSQRWGPWALIGCAAIAIDRLLLVSIYERAHTLAQAIGFAALTAAIAAFFGSVRLRRAGSAFAVLALAWLLSLGASSRLRARIDAALPHDADGRRVYLGRLVRHLRVLESTARREHPALPAGAHHLAVRYEIHDTQLDEEWSARATRPPSAAGENVGPPWNVVVFFVDTLRADVASDASTMPETASWMREHVSFSRAYAPASSTLLSLAPLLSCRYDTKPDEAPALLQLAADRGMTRSLFIPSRASGYHRAYFPTFRFDHEEVVEDMKDDVLLTGDDLVDRALSWLRQDRAEAPFFLWVYDFDVHEWPHVSPQTLEAIANDARLSKTEGLPWRYRAAARAVDRSFARLRSGLDALGLLDRTVIVFLADHGEGLGEHGQWAHSSYLWETLVHVPLAVEAPGLAPRRVDVPVSLVDLPTTLSRFIGPLANEERCHGEDVLADDAAPRRLPILLSAMFEGTLVRVGLLDSSERKLVVDLREGHARVYDLPADEENATDAPAEAARMLNRLVRSPLYPRP